MKSIKVVLSSGLIVLSLGLFSKAHALNNPDTMTISVTPSVTYAVSIASVTAGTGYQFGTVALAATTLSTAAIVVTNTGTISEYFAMAVSNTAPDNWAAAAGGTAAANAFGLIGVFNATQPASGSFGGDALVNAIPGASDALYGQASSKTAVNGTKNLWLKLNMPTSLSVGTGGAQTMVMSVNGQAL